MEAKILKCTCENEFQDKTYGKGMRVHNPGGKSGTKDSNLKMICTCCGNKK